MTNQQHDEAARPVDAEDAPVPTDHPATLRRAADHVRSLATDATYKEGRWFVDVAGPVASTMWLGPSHDVLTALWQQAAYVAAMGPVVGLLLADLFAEVADSVEQDGGIIENATDEAVLSLAQELLRSAV